MRSADELRPYLTESQRTDLAGGDQFGHRPDSVFDGDTRIEPVTVVEVDDVGAQSTKARLARRGDILGTPVQHDPVAGIVDLGAELRCQDHLVAEGMYRGTDQLLIVAKTADVRRRGDVSGTVHIGSVQEVDAEIDRRSDRIDGLTVIR